MKTVIPRVPVGRSLFHYSSKPLDQLLSKNLMNDVKYEKADEYGNNISFFFDPIPSKKIVSIFPPTHGFWKDGAVIYEHVIDASKIPDRAILAYWIAESKAKLEFMDKFIKDNNWVDDNPELLARYKSELREMQLGSGEYGKNKSNLLPQIAKHKHQTENAFIAASKRSDFAENATKYAANVPHLMLYVSAPIEVAYVNKVVLGQDQRELLI